MVAHKEIDEDERLEWILSHLRASTRLLAEEPEEQIRYLSALGTLPLTDELAIQFGESVLLLDQLVAARLVSEETAAELRQIDRRLAAISGPSNARYWTPEALQESEEWQEIRRRGGSIPRLGHAEAFYFRLDRGEDQSVAWITQVRQLEHWISRIEHEIARGELIALLGPYGRSLSIGIGSKDSVASWQEEVDPPYFASKGPSDDEEPVLVLIYGGHWSEFARRHVIDRDSAVEAAKRYVQTGARPDNIEWVEV